jgi:nucleoside-diphosphate-sugar epimerase
MSSGPSIALTGATGFIGRFLLKDLKRRGYRVRALLRHPDALVPEIESAIIGDLARPANLAQALRGIDYVVHSAAIAHAMSGRPDDDYRTINAQATVSLARAGAAAGVKRFVFLSSIRAQTDASANSILTEDMEPAPTDAYGRSKLEAEQALATLGVDWVALRPVLVYGPGVKGNLAALFKLARMPIPLPFRGFKARRSLLSIANLAEAVDAVIRAEVSPNRALIAADSTPVTLGEIVAAYRSGTGRSAGLLHIPPGIIEGSLSLIGKAELGKRLGGSLVVDSSALRSVGWVSKIDTLPGLTDLARAESAGDDVS